MSPKEELPCPVSKCKRKKMYTGFCAKHWHQIPAVMQVRIATAYKAVAARPVDKALAGALQALRDQAVGMLS